MSFAGYENHIGNSLRELRESGLFRQIPPVDHGADKFLLLDGKPLLNLASNNYLGLAGHPALKAGAVSAVEKYGASSGASRLISGNFALADELETEAAAFKDTEAALFFGAGFAANVAVMSALADRQTVVFADRLNHASIIDGVRLSGARHVRYAHNDLSALAALMEKHASATRKLVVTDTVFSMDGDLADLRGLADLCDRHDALLVVDEAHATGVMGPGLAHVQGVADRVDVHMSTFSKGLGSSGAFVAANRQIIDFLRNRARPFIFSTFPPPAVIGANLAALRLVRETPDMGKRVLALGDQARTRLRKMGLDTGESATPIIPVMIGDSEHALAARDALMRQGVYVGAVRPPTVPQGTARLRISLRADLTDNDMETLYAALTGLHEEVL
ncbi:8-amino-7-oxononanoate synthase [Pseudodesulfovibrio tunisiensis]|uniref:8-amino-7-oxononanoate synthase n=1 Tax=Pseudodesulfovibrio tunisiensis TaxID=463192 RepID=UPI002436C657|nr:8-amino-7-oxononanoate synthase [Pseudodesulfovibrio tunisiensis]